MPKLKPQNLKLNISPRTSSGWLPPEARWHAIKAKAKSLEIGKVAESNESAIERKF